MHKLFLDAEGRFRTGWRILALAVVLVAAILTVNVGWKAAGLPGRATGGPWYFMLFAGLISGAVLVGIKLLLRIFEGQGLVAIGLPVDPGAVRATMIGTALGAVPVLLLLGIALAGGYGSVAYAGLGWAGFFSTLLPILVAGFLLAAWEEVVLRGYLLRQLTLGINAWAAAVITGLLFGLAHSGNPGANWEGLVYTALGGIMMAWLMFRSGSLWLLIGYHFGWNATASALLGLELSGFEEKASIVTATLSGPGWLTGGSYGFEASLPALICEALTLGMAIWLTGRRSASRRHASAFSRAC
jgi:membrane protease YdiL (CAAX protease family)